MNILLATPYLSANHWDSGLFWAAALSRLGHSVRLWDHRLESPPSLAGIDCSIAMKGGPDLVRHLTHRRAVYWPDDLDRTPGLEHDLLEVYSVAATPVMPTPKGWLWLPTGWDPLIHRPSGVVPLWDSSFIGTGTPRKAEFLLAMGPTLVFGNSWDGLLQGVNKPIYLHDYVDVLGKTRVSINLHRSDMVGINRRILESIACAFTLTDVVPGVEEVLGAELTRQVGFTTPEEGRERLRYFLDHPAERDALWRQERAAIAPYTYEAQAKRLLEALV